MPQDFSRQIGKFTNKTPKQSKGPISSSTQALVADLVSNSNLNAHQKRVLLQKTTQGKSLPRNVHSTDGILRREPPKASKGNFMTSRPKQHVLGRGIKSKASIERNVDKAPATTKPPPSKRTNNTRVQPDPALSKTRQVNRYKDESFIKKSNKLKDKMRNKDMERKARSQPTRDYEYASSSSAAASSSALQSPTRRRKGKTDMFAEVVNEIEERRQFLREMTALDADDRDTRARTMTEIRERVALLKQIDLARETDPDAYFI